MKHAKWLHNIGVAFIDLCKAFNMVNLNIVLAKLSTFGISGVEKQLLKSYLTNHFQSMTVDGKLSDLITFTMGVPQGSILEALLFPSISMIYTVRS